MLIRLRPSISVADYVQHSPCQGRFEVEVSSDTLVGQIVKLISVVAKKDRVVIRRIVNGEWLLPEDCSKRMDQVVNFSDPEYTFEYQWLKSSDCATQTDRAPRKRRNPSKPETFPPNGVSRFKYLEIRRSIC